MTAAQRLDRPATYEDLLALPDGVKGEILDGVLYTQVRPRPRHMRCAGELFAVLRGPADLGEGGAGGWWIVIEPGIELPGSPEIAPDIGGWRRERLPAFPEDEPFRLAPDWVCEILSRSNRTYDRRTKFPFYARVGVGHLWAVDPDARTIEVKRLEGGRWTDIGVFADDELMRAEPFESVTIPLARLWRPREPSP